MRLLDWLLSDRVQAFIAGGLGGLVRWLALREKLQDGLISIVIGAICALYLGPFAIPALAPITGRLLVDPAAQAGLSGFLIGTGGTAVVGFVIDLWRARRRLRDDK